MDDLLKKLLDHSVEYATELLVETGEAYPFGAYIDLADNVHPLEMEFDPKNMPKVGKVMEALTKYCSEEMAENRMKAWCLSYEVKIALSESQETEAIAFEMTHPSEKNIPKFYLPYTPIPKENWKDEEDFSKVNVGELFAVK